MRTSLAITILISLVISPATSFAAESAKAPHAGGMSPAANSATPDTYENDDFPNTTYANPVGAFIPIDGEGFYTQSHTIDLASGNLCDVDWYYFDVDADEIAIDEVRFLIEAVSLDQDVDLIVEVYASGVTPGDPVTGVWTVDPAAIAFGDDSFNSPNPAAEFFPTAAGRYWVRVRPYYTGTTYDGHAGAYTFKIQRTLAERVAGGDRYATAVEASRRGISTQAIASQTNRTIVLANGLNYPDALSGAALARANGFNGSLLLTPQNSLPTAVRNEIIRTGTRNVYVLGGTNVVSNTVISQVQAINPGIAVKRVWGTDRMKTSIAVARELYAKHGTPRGLAFVAYAYNYPDALAATPLAVYNGAPIFLTRTNSLSSETLSAMADIGVTDIVILGSTTVVSTSVYNQCAAYAGGTDHVLRVAGANRYETAKEVASWASDLKGPGVRDDNAIGTVANPAGLSRLYVDNLGLASGENFPDALSGGVLCGCTRHPILLTPKSTVTPYVYDVYLGLPAGKTDFYTDAGAPPSSGVGLVFGSEAAVGRLPLVVFSWMLGY